MKNSQPKPLAQPDPGSEQILDLARVFARALALAHHNAESLPKPANEN